MRTGRVIWTIGDGTKTKKTHLVADEGKQLTKDGISFYFCVDVDDAEGWHEVDSQEAEE